MAENKHELSIGEVAQATGVSVYTLRQWERRYGHPKSVKRDSGHRRYSIKEISRLRLVAQSLSLGLRANKVVSLTHEQLLRVIEEKDKNAPILEVERWFQCVMDWDQDQLTKHIQSDWKCLSPLDFINQRVRPFLTRIGESWQLDEISIAQEHYFSELLESFLAEKWRALNEKNSGDIFILASPEGEGHSLGLHMCALILTLHKRKVLFLGSSTPYQEIVKASLRGKAKAVCLSISSNYSQSDLEDRLKRLKSEIGKPTELIVGGGGAPSKMKGIVQFNCFTRFSKWLKAK